MGASHNSLDRRELLFAFSVILTVTLAANLYNVFGLNILVQDDAGRLYLFNGDMPVARGGFLGLAVEFKKAFIWLFSEQSVQLARITLLLIGMVPLGILFYLLCRIVFDLSLWPALLSAVLINCIPDQWLIPTFLDGSYMVWGAIALVVTLIACDAYLGRERAAVWLLLCVVFAWTLVCELTAELGIFLWPIILVFAWTSRSTVGQKLTVSVLVLSVTAWRLAVYLHDSQGRVGRRPVDLDWQEILTRMTDSLEWWIPYKVGTYTVVLTAVLLLTWVVYQIAMGWRREGMSSSHAGRLLVLACWFGCAAAPFWLITPYYTVRHFFIAFMALTLLVLLAIQQAGKPLADRYRWIGWASFCFIVAIFGYQRYAVSSELFVPWNKREAEMKSLLLKETLGDDTQVAMVGMASFTGGYYIWSSGHLQHMLDMPSIRGIIGQNYDFYDPFNKKHCFYRHRMSCLDSSGKLVAFRRARDGTPMRMRYFLRWLSPGDEQSQWTLFHTDQQNTLQRFREGTGLDAYREALIASGLSSEDVLWGTF